MNYTEALAAARARSIKHHCVTHVEIVVRRNMDDTPYIWGYILSDWFDSGTVASFDSNGERIL